MAQQVQQHLPQAVGVQPAPPTTYVDLYRQRADPLEGQYTALFNRHLVASGDDSDVLLNKLLSSSNEVPKVFLCLVEEILPNRPARLRTVTLHRVGRYFGSQVRTSPWDDRTFAFASDMMLGNHIRIVEFPPGPFELAGAQTVPTTANVHALLAAHPARNTLPAMAVGSPDSEQLDTRLLVQVPPKYVEIVMGRSFTPRQLWDELGGAIVNDQNAGDCVHLLDWIRVALTLRVNPADPARYLKPSNCLPPGSLTALDVDGDLQAVRWNWVREDLPALDPKAPLSSTEQLMATIGVFRQERLEEREADLERRASHDAPLLPSDAFQRDLVAQWGRLSCVHAEADLPHLYKAWAKATKAERRPLFARLVEDRCRHPGAATGLSPVVTKELYEMILNGRFAPHPHQMDDLTVGVQPFTCGYAKGSESGKQVEARAAGFDLMMAGQIAPTLGEQSTFRTSAVDLPTTTFQGMQMVRGLSIVLDVVQGPDAPLARRLREFCAGHLRNLENTLNIQADVDPELGARLMPSILRWFQVRIGFYLHRLVVEQDPTASLPVFTELYQNVVERAYHLLPPLPKGMRIEPAAPPPPPAAPRGGPAARGAAPPAGSGTGSGPDQRASVVRNPRTVAAWVTALDASNRRLAELRDHAPTSTRNGRTTPLCLNYHLRGTCYESCSRTETHRPLSVTERAAISQMVSQQLSSAPGGTGSGAAGGTPAPAPAPADGVGEA